MPLPRFQLPPAESRARPTGAAGKRARRDCVAARPDLRAAVIEDAIGPLRR